MVFLNVLNLSLILDLKNIIKKNKNSKKNNPNKNAGFPQLIVEIKNKIEKDKTFFIVNLSIVLIKRANIKGTNI